ncbi:MAG: patatin-like phospholipase family protein [Ignavibacteria bacterium]|nr:patatin-like phospholipase family protein [Ignavibacteria bacterium]
MNNKKRALVISGGGAKGAWAGGLIQQMIEERGYDWDIYVGTSTGSLLITLTPLKEMNRLKEAYTSVSNKNIFTVDPFTKKGKINMFNAAWRIIKGKTSLGESGGLIKIIKQMYTVQDFYNVRKMKKDVYACAANYTHGTVDYAYNQTSTYEDYVNFTWASTSVPLAMDFVDIYNSRYLDGGVLMHVPIQKAIDCGADEIDVIVLRPEQIDTSKWEANNMFDVLMRTIDIMQEHISQSNVLIAQLNAGIKDVKLRIRYTPYKLTDNSLMFDKEQMIKWWNEGYEWGRKDNQSQKIYLKKK